MLEEKVCRCSLESVHTCSLRLVTRYPVIDIVGRHESLAMPWRHHTFYIFSRAFLIQDFELSGSPDLKEMTAMREMKDQCGLHSRVCNDVLALPLPLMATLKRRCFSLRL